MKLNHSISYRPDIDGLRAIAVLAVLFYHAFPHWVPGGYVGVDVFFVISGFLITSIISKELKNNSFKFSDFYARRVQRIFPALILVMLVTLCAGWFLLLPDAYRDLGKHLAGGAGFVSNFVLWAESGYFDVGAEKKILLHLWSLSIEEQFYIFWPLILFWSWKKNNSIFKIILAVTVVSFAVNMAFVYNRGSAVFYWPFFRFWELAAGGLLAVVLPRFSQTQFRFKNILPYIGLLLILSATFLFKSGDVFPGWRALFPTLGGMLIISADKNTWLNRILLSNRFLVQVGLISYPLYLWHWVLLTFQRNSVPESNNFQITIAVIASFIFSWLTFQWIEKPLRFTTTTVRLKIVTYLSLTMLLLLVAGYGVYVKKGFPERLPLEVREISTFKRENFNWEKAVRAGFCHNDDPSKIDVPAECVEKKRPLVVLWGDSYAAAIYPALSELQKTNSMGVAQFTSSACPPILNVQYEAHRKNCNEINEKIISKLPSILPEIILLGTTWDPQDYRVDEPNYMLQLKGLITKIESETPNSQVYLVGPVPQWERPLQECALQYFNQFKQMLPKRTHFCLKSTTNVLDQKMKTFSEQMGLGYISIWKRLCNEEGCLTRVGEELLDLESIDGGHLSPSAARFVKDELAATISSLYKH